MISISGQLALSYCINFFKVTICIRKVVEFSFENETYLPLMPALAVFIFENLSRLGITRIYIIFSAFKAILLFTLFANSKYMINMIKPKSVSPIIKMIST